MESTIQKMIKEATRVGDMIGGKLVPDENGTGYQIRKANGGHLWTDDIVTWGSESEQLRQLTAIKQALHSYEIANSLKAWAAMNKDDALRNREAAVAQREAAVARRERAAA